MSVAKQLALHLEKLHFGGSYTGPSLTELLADIDWQQAVRKEGDVHSIAELLYHIHYYVAIVLRVMQGGPLEGSDRYSYDLPPIADARDWEALKEVVWRDARTFAAVLSGWTDEQLSAPFDDGKYGDFLRNILTILEHSQYHTGQISLLRKKWRTA
ncbi:MAG: hypothetical protein RLY31_1435 [Bacteroidota bacterium]|jgi:uncharacterized damage-inducible protein DinB